MGDTVKELPRFFSTEDVRKILKIGNKACLELFHREDFPCERVGKSYRIAEENFNEYFKTIEKIQDFGEEIAGDFRNTIRQK